MKFIDGYILDALIKDDNMKLSAQQKINTNGSYMAQQQNDVNKSYHEYLKQLDSICPWWMELREEASPHGYKLWRKTKAGLWELVATITTLQNKRIAYEWFKTMWIKEQINYPHYAAMKVTTLNDRQIYSTYYDRLYRNLSFRAINNEAFGISINKGEDYLIYHEDLPGDNLNPIADYFCKLAKQHKGIKSFSKARFDEADNYLYWGWLTFNDGHKISVAIDSELDLYKEYKDNLQPINLSHLTKIK